MKYRKNFNNLFDSICLTILISIAIILYLISLYFGVINPKVEVDAMLLLIILSSIFGIIIIGLTVLIILYCYEYWVLTDDVIYGKKLFRKKVIINLNEIKKVERKEIFALILGTYKSDSYTIYSENQRVILLVNEKNFSDIEHELTKFFPEINKKWFNDWLDLHN